MRLDEGRTCKQCGKPLPSGVDGRRKFCDECRYKRKMVYINAYAKRHRKKFSAYQKDRIAWLKDHGICIVCGQRNAIQGKTKCEVCREKKRAYDRMYRRRLKEEKETT